MDTTGPILFPPVFLPGRIALPARLQLQPPLAADREQHLRSGVGECYGVSRLDQLAATLEDDQRGLTVEPRGKAQGTRIAAIVEVSGDRLGDDPPPRSDLVQIEMREAVLDQERNVALLEVGANGRIGEIDQLAIEDHFGGGQQVLFSPAGGHRRSRKIFERRSAEGISEGPPGSKIGAEIGQHLPQRSLGALGAIDGPKAPLHVIEAVVPGAELKGRESQRVTAMSDPPKLSPAHPSKLTSCLAAARTAANCAGSSARRRTSIGASSSRRVLVPKSQARAVFSSKLSTIMRTIL